jgi:hypothetical protein
MIHPLSELYKYKYVLRNSKGHIIYDGSPLCSIKKENTNEYWNGIGWSSSEVLLSMMNEGDGTYSYEITFDQIGVYTITAKDDTYPSSEDVFEVKVSSGEAVLVGDTATITKTIVDEGGSPLTGLSPQVSIERKYDNQFYDELLDDFVASETSIDMVEVSDGVYSYDFTYDNIADFTVTITESTTSLNDSYTLSFAESVHESMFPQDGSLFLISSETLTGTDGEKSNIVDVKGSPISGTVIEVHNKNTKEVYRAMSDNLGKWSLYVPEGIYIILVSHPDFKSVSIEREVF